MTLPITFELPPLNLEVEKRTGMKMAYVIRAQMGDEQFTALSNDMPTHAQIGTFASNCVVRFLMRDWSGLNGGLM